MNKNRAAKATDFEYLLYKTLGKKYLVVKSYFFGTLSKMQWRRLSDQSSSGVLLVENVVSERITIRMCQVLCRILCCSLF